MSPTPGRCRCQITASINPSWIWGSSICFSRIYRSLKIQHHYCNRPKTNRTHVAGISTQQKKPVTCYILLLDWAKTSVMSQVGRPVFQFRTLQPEVHQPIATSLPATAPPVQQAVFWWWIGAPKKTHPRLGEPPTKKSQLFFSLICPKMQKTINYWRWVICDKSMYKHFVQTFFWRMILRVFSEKKSVKFTKISSLPSFGGHLQGFGLQLWQ